MENDVYLREAEAEVGESRAERESGKPSRKPSRSQLVTAFMESNSAARLLVATEKANKLKEEASLTTQQLRGHAAMLEQDIADRILKRRLEQDRINAEIDARKSQMEADIAYRAKQSTMQEMELELRKRELEIRFAEAEERRLTAKALANHKQ